MRLLLLLLAPTLGCGANVGATRGPGSADWARGEALAGEFHFTVRVPDGASTLDVTVCFDEAPPDYLVCPQANASAAIVRAEVRTPERRGEALAQEGRRLRLPADLGRGGCVGYVVDLDRAIGASFWNGSRRGGTTLANAAAWLYRPSGLTATSRGTLRFELADGMDAAVAYPREGDHYVLDRTAFAYLSHTVFGRFTRLTTEVHGATIDIARLEGPIAATDEELVGFVEHAGGMVSDIAGRFPVAHALVVIVPVGRGGSGVAFGNVGRGGGASVMLIVHENATRAMLDDDWVPPHELTHLVTPYVRRPDAWLSEGIATYYQEVLRARAGVRTPADAWAALDEGLTRGREDGTGRTLEQESAHMFETAAFRRVYWGGTAIALMVDVMLRQRGSSLDEALTELSDCCASPVRTWGARELIAKLDELTGSHVLSELAAAHLGATAFPDVTATYAYLGIHRLDDGRLAFDDEAEGASIRGAIMRARGH